MIRVSPKIEIIDHFDDLINKIDIDIDISLEKFNDKQTLAELLESSEIDRKDFCYENDDYFDVKLHKKNDTSNIWPKSTKVIDYLTQIRMRAIEELRKAQKDSLEYYKINSSIFKCENNRDELKSRLFADKFHFQLSLKQTDKLLWFFNLFTFETNFYMSQSDINSLQ